MIIDAENLALGSVLESDLCIVGAGPAGLLLAHELASRNVRVTLLEAGGENADERAQALLEGEDLTGEYHNPRDSRHCQLGGTVRIWNTPVRGEKGAKYVPLDEIDFEKRDWVPHSGWPFPRTALLPYYKKAQELCGLGPFAYEADDWADPEHHPVSFGDEGVVSGVYQLGEPRPFLDRLIKSIGENENITCVLNAPAVELIGEAGSAKVNAIKVAVASDRRVTVRSRRFVLAAGGIENARLLLASTSQCPSGLGNEHDVVGRYYMDHPIYFSTEMIPRDPDIFDRFGFYDLREVRGTPILGRLTLSPDTLRRYELLNLSLVLYPKIAGYRSAGVEALRQLRSSLRHRRFVSATRWVWPALRNSGDIQAYNREVRHNPIREGAHFWHRALKDGSRFATFEPECYLEQPPDPENRVMLSATHDLYGRQIAAIHWRWGRQSHESAEAVTRIFAKAFERAGIGSFRCLKSPRVNPSGHHHMGATRMHENPKLGVVNEECRVHGVSNLFIAGSSVFPTGGYANPTLTVLALCFKLADFLRTPENASGS